MATIFAILFVLSVTRTLTFGNTGINVVIIFTPLFLGLIFAFFEGFFHETLLKYKIQIKVYRERKTFLHIMKLLENGEMSTAIDYYNTSISNGVIRDFLWGHIITIRLLSDNPEWKAIGEEIINKLKEEWNPNNVFNLK